MQRAFILYFLKENKTNLDELNQLLNEGWRVVSQSAMGGGGGNNAVFSLVVLSKDE